MGHAANKREAIQRLEELLQFAPDEGYSRAYLARELVCNPSTISRYLNEIEQYRELIYVSHGHYRLNPMQNLSQIKLHPDEALTIYLALRRYIRQTNNAPAFMIRALEKVTLALPRLDLVTLLNESVEMLKQERPASDKQTHIWRTLLESWLKGYVLRLTYYKPNAGPREHIFEPYLFEPMAKGDGTYVVGWSHTREEMRTLKIDRIRKASLLPDQYKRPEDLSITRLLEHAWNIWYGAEIYKVELIFKPHVAARVQESIYSSTEEMRLLSDGSLYWSVEVSGYLEILSWIRGWGPNVEVIGPEKIRNIIIKDLEAALSQYR